MGTRLVHKLRHLHVYTRLLLAVHVQGLRLLNISAIIIADHQALYYFTDLSIKKVIFCYIEGTCIISTTPVLELYFKQS